MDESSTKPEKRAKKSLKLTVDEIKRFKYDLEPKVRSDGEKQYPKCVWWDTELKGFGVRVFPSGAKSYVYKYRTKANEPKFLTLATVSEKTLVEARKMAKVHAGEIINGADPLTERREERHGMLMSELCKKFVNEHTIKSGHSKKRLEEVQRRNRLYIIPALGMTQVQNVTKTDVRDLHNKIGMDQKHPVLANCVRRQLHAMFEKAKEWDCVRPGFVNPAKEIEDFKEHSRDMFVRLEHLDLLARALEAEPNESAKLAIWLLILTGKRKNEILKARWNELDETQRVLTIPKTKNGESERLPLTNEAWSIIERARAIRKDNHPFIFPGDNPEHHLVNIYAPWSRIRQEAFRNGATSLKKVTKAQEMIEHPDGTKEIKELSQDREEWIVPHGLRHTVAVWLVNEGNLDTVLVGKVLNHRSLTSTSGYAKYQQEAKRGALQVQSAMVASALSAATKGGDANS
jgi:integrase